MKAKKIISFLVILALAGTLAACGGAGGSSAADTDTSSAAKSSGSEQTASVSAETPGSSAAAEIPEIAYPEAPEVQYNQTQDERESAVSGDWYTEIDGLVYCLTLDPAGTYTAGFTSISGNPASGTWALQDDGNLLLDDCADAPMLVTEGSLTWPRMAAVLTREKPEEYAPAALRTDAVLTDYEGYWKSVLVEVGGMPVEASLMGDNTDLYIEGSDAALGGDIFGDVIMPFQFENGAMRMTMEDGANSIALTLALQQDELLRLTLSASGQEDVVMWLSPVYTGQAPDFEALIDEVGSSEDTVAAEGSGMEEAGGAAGSTEAAAGSTEAAAGSTEAAAGSAEAAADSSAAGN